MMNKKLNFAIIGCGKIAPRHAENILKQGILAAVCDIIPERADKFATTFHSSPFYSLEEMLDRNKYLDVVVVCTPNGSHAEHSIKALAAGFHVLCEKPMCLTKDEALKMKQAEQRADKRIFVVKQNRYNPPVVFVKKLIEEGKLGRILSVQVNGFWNRSKDYFKDSWKGTKKGDGGILYTQFSHFIDIAYWFAGDIKLVKTVKRNFQLNEIIETEDNCFVLAEFNSGAIGTFNFSISAYAKNMEGSITLLAEKGTVKIGGQYLNILEYQQIEGMEPVILEKGNPANQYGKYEGSMSNHDKVYDNLIVALKDPAHSFAGIEDGMKTVEIIEKIYASCE